MSSNYLLFSFPKNLGCVIGLISSTTWLTNTQINKTFLSKPSPKKQIQKKILSCNTPVSSAKLPVLPLPAVSNVPKATEGKEVNAVLVLACTNLP
jgi:hypothetical protein